MKNWMNKVAAMAAAFFEMVMTFVASFSPQMVAAGGMRFDNEGQGNKQTTWRRGEQPAPDESKSMARGNGQSPAVAIKDNWRTDQPAAAASMTPGHSAIVHSSPHAAERANNPAVASMAAVTAGASCVSNGHTRQ